ncbi:MAG: tRNA-dihydrouridine synthase [Acidobacteria bacterium]|nr:tRNA-dihydrouridine synthase [Acidobacteriota bacterium]
MTVWAVGRVGLRSPVMTAAGTAGTGTELAAFGGLGDLGAVVVKSLAPYPWEGNPSPRLVGVPGGMLNAVGLSGPGIPRWIERDLPLLEREGATVVVSVWGRTADEYEDAAVLLADVSARLAAVEVNLSCPNLSSGQGASHPMFAHDPAMSAEIVRRMARAGLPVWAKLSPNTDRLVEVARAVADEGADAVTLVNTVRGRAVDPRTGAALLGAGSGGLSGRAIHPVALRAVAEVRAALPEIAIVGAGGVVDADSALALLRTGADAVQVGTATFADPRAPWRIQRDVIRALRRHPLGARGRSRT